MPFFNFLPTHPTASLEQALGNARLAADTAKEAAITVNQALGNVTPVATAANSGTKALALGYGVALTGASLIDAVTAKNTCSKLLFLSGSVCGMGGTISSGLSLLNTSVGLSPFSLAAGTVGGAFYWLGRKANFVARNADFPGF